jgi:integrase
MSEKTEKQDAKEAFLEYIRTHKSKGTAKSYKCGFQKFEQWLGKSADEILEQRRKDVESKDAMKLRRFHDLIEQFHKELIEKEHKSPNTARTLSIGVVQFFNYWCVPVKVTFQTEITRRTAIPEASDWRKMYALADLKGKLAISLGLDVAWRIGDILNLRKSDIPDLEQECPIQIERITQKEREFSSTFISCETVELLKAYVPTLREDNEFLFQTKSNGSHADDEYLNGMIQDLGFKAGFCDEKGKVLNGRNKGKRLSWHSFRKTFLTTATQLGIENDQKCLLVGKSLEKGQSMETYIGDPKLKNAFLAIRNALALTKTQDVEGKNEEIEKLRNALVESQHKITTLETTNEELRRKLEEIEWNQKTMNKTIMNLDEDIAQIKTRLGIKEKVRD